LPHPEQIIPAIWRNPYSHRSRGWVLAPVAAVSYLRRHHTKRPLERLKRRSWHHRMFRAKSASATNLRSRGTTLRTRLSAVSPQSEQTTSSLSSVALLLWIHCARQRPCSVAKREPSHREGAVHRFDLDVGAEQMSLQQGKTVS